jgi:hypothetical protein
METRMTESVETSGPTLTRAKWFPAAVVHPSLPKPLRRTFVVVAEGGEFSGLWVYSRPDEVAFHAPINWLRQPALPKTERSTRSGVDIMLTDGTTAVITTGGSCRCGALGRWAGPAFATTVTAR